MKNTAELRELFLNYLAQNSFDDEPQGLYAPVNYILDIGGKRMRPVMLLMACQLFDENVEKALPAALAVEIFHNFTLLHDDIMDDAPLRRGKTTVHEKYDTNTAILSGDVMMIHAYQYLAKASPQLLPDLLRIMNQLAIGVCEGQQYDMDFETVETVSIPEYLKMIELKTSVLLAGSMQMGALIGGASAKDAEQVYEFGRNVGIAFQLQDDILDTFGDPEKFGKRVGGDIVQNKKTFLVLKTLELATAEDRQNLHQLLQTAPADEAAKIEQVRTLFKKYKIRQQAGKKMNAYLDTAFHHLDLLEIPEARKVELRNLAHYLINREV